MMKGEIEGAQGRADLLVAEEVGGERLRPRAIVIATAGAFFVATLLYGMVVPLLPSFAATFGLDNLAVGWLFTSFAIANILATVLAGTAVDRVGCRTVFLIGMAFLAASTIAFAWANSFAALLSCRVIQGLGAGAAYVAGYAGIAKYLSAGERGSAVAVASSGIALGFVLGPALAGLLLDAYGQAAVFLAGAGVVIIEAIAITLLLPADRRSGSERHAALAEEEPVPTWLLVAWLLPGFLCGLALGAMESSLPRHLVEQLSLSGSGVGALFAVSAGAYVIGAYAGGRVSEHRRDSTLVSGWAIGAVGLAFIGMPSTFAAQAAMMVVVGLGLGMMVVTIVPALAELLESHRQTQHGAGAAAYNLVFTLGVLLGAPVVGYGADLLSFPVAAAALAGVLMVALAGREAGRRWSVARAG